MLSRPRLAAWIALILAFASSAAQVIEKAHPPLRVILTAREAHDLPVNEARRHYPVHLRAVVTYYDPYIDKRHGALFVHDQSGSIFIMVPLRPILPIHAGTLVDVVAATGAGDYAPVLVDPKIRVLGQTHVPASAQPVTWTQLQSGAVDGHWVEVEGMVHSVRYQNMNAILDLATGQGEMTATTVRDPTANYDALVDSLIRLHANAAPVFNLKRQMVGAHLFFPSLSEVTVVQRSPSDPFATPPLPVSRLLQFEVRAGLPHRIHVRGIVTLQWPQRMLCIQQGNDGLCFRTTQADRVQVGSMVDAVGFPATRDFKATLGNAQFRISPNAGTIPASLITPKAITAERALRDDFDRQLVTVDGQLVGQAVSAGQSTLILRSGNVLFAAILPRNESGPKLLPWKEGSILRISGVCSVLVDPKATTEGDGGVSPESADILLRDPADVVVLHAPSWWTPRHTLVILGLFAVAVLVFVTWVVLLRRQVEEQTRAIRLSEERLRHMSQHDSLTGLPNRALLLDRMQMALKRIKRFDGFLGLLMVDLDGFKEVNDTLGHQAGDRVLCEAARRICAVVRQTDTVARLGGDEFVVLLPDLHLAREAEAVAAKIVATLVAPIYVAASRAQVTGSIGVCTSSDPEIDTEKLFHSVDAAMYQAKRMGKNCYFIFQPESRDQRTADTPRQEPASRLP